MGLIERKTNTHTRFAESTSYQGSQKQPQVSTAQGRKWENLSNFKVGSHYLDKDLNLHSRTGLMGVINAVKHFFGAFSLKATIPALRAAVVENPKMFQGNGELKQLHNKTEQSSSSTTKIFQALFSDVSKRSTKGRVEVAYNLNRAQRKILNTESSNSPAYLSQVAQGIKDVNAHASKALMKQGLPKSYIQYFMENSKALVSAAQNSHTPLATYVKETVKQIDYSRGSANIDAYINESYRNNNGNIIPNVAPAYKGVINKILINCNTDYEKVLKSQASRSFSSGTKIAGSGKYSAASFESGHAW